MPQHTHRMTLRRWSFASSIYKNGASLLILVFSVAPILLIVKLQGNTNTKEKPSTAGYVGDKVPVFNLSPTMEPSHLDPIDPSVRLVPRSPRPVVGIDEAHRYGFVHMGAWVFLIDAAGKLLLPKRGSKLVTCPNTWGPLGEHMLPEDAMNPSVNAIRGLREELGTGVVEFISEEGNLTEHPLYYIRKYGPSNGDRIDRQVTYLWHVRLKMTSDELERGNILMMDEEVADMGWWSVDDLDDWIERNPEDFCHDTIVQMLLKGLQALKKQSLRPNSPSV